ncbi:MAG: N-acetylmuramoyl-L-alanine amidase [Candidatus Cloacimonadia bacterium]
MSSRLKISLICVFLLVITVTLFGLENLKVEYQNSSDVDEIAITIFDETPYFKALDLNRVFNAHISEDLLDRRLFAELYDQRFIFLIDSSYGLFHSELFNFTYNLLYVEGKHYLPLIFLQETLPNLLPDRVFYNSKTNMLVAELPLDNSFHTIVIDPGHGGKDPGAVGHSGKTYEKDVTLQVAKILQKRVEEQLGIKALLTRDNDRFVTLQERTAFANKHQANLFISIHCNAAQRPAAHGIEVFFLSAAKSDEARAVEALENSVVEKYEGGKEAVKKYDDLSFILMDMAQAEQLQESSYLATKLQANLIQSTGADNRGVKQAGFYVLRGAFMPAVLVELGFITNKQEEMKLKDPAYQSRLSDAVFEGVKSFIQNYEMFR